MDVTLVIGQERLHKGKCRAICPPTRRRGRHSAFGGCYKKRYFGMPIAFASGSHANDYVLQKLLLKRLRLDEAVGLRL